MIPKKPTTTEWAAGNYATPGDPWNGQPKRVLPAEDGFTPNAEVAADYLNYVLNRNASEAATGLEKLWKTIATMPVMNWRPATTLVAVGTGTNYIKKLSWSRQTSAYGRWLGHGVWYMLLADSAANAQSFLKRSYDGGATWYDCVGSAVTTGVGTDINANMIALPSGDAIITKGDNTSQLNVRRYIDSSNTFADVTPIAATNVWWRTMEHTLDGSGMPSGAILIGTSGGNTKIATCSADGVSWSDLTANIPADAALTATTSKWAVAVNKDRMLAIPCVAGQTKFMSGNAGFAAAGALQTLSFSMIGKTPIDLTYSKEWDGFFLVTQNGTATEVWYGTNADNPTWTQIYASSICITQSIKPLGATIAIASRWTDATPAQADMPGALWYLDDQLLLRKVPNSRMENPGSDVRAEHPTLALARDGNGEYQLIAYTSDLASLRIGMHGGQFLS